MIRSTNKVNLYLQKILYHLRFYDTFFYINALRWHFKHKKPDNITTKDILELFYLDFLRIPKKDCKIIEMTKSKLVTRCINDCPILDFSLALGLDTKISCKRISEGPCEYFLRKYGARPNTFTSRIPGCLVSRPIK